MPDPDRAPAKRTKDSGASKNGIRNGNDRLTSRQEEILLHCERRGYYEIPRRQTLRDLSHELGISVPSLSLILRRAEAKLVREFARQVPLGSAVALAAERRR